MPRLGACGTPKYRRHRASGQARVTIASRDIYLGPYGTAASHREYDGVIGEWLQPSIRTVDPQPPGILDLSGPSPCTTPAVVCL